jgi:SpoVK/Ycf46/Vps4 family AAA+-type ATPase
MQDRQGDVFVVATANDIQQLPPEFLRKGRFDEIFFVDLPDSQTREEVFRIHLESRGYGAESFGLEALAAETEGFSGSEIEEVVVSALYTAFAGHDSLDTEALRSEVRATRPLSVTMSEHIQALRAWAKGRTVRAN